VEKLISRSVNNPGHFILKGDDLAGLHPRFVRAIDCRGVALRWILKALVLLRALNLSSLQA